MRATLFVRVPATPGVRRFLRRFLFGLIRRNLDNVYLSRCCHVRRRVAPSVPGFYAASRLYHAWKDAICGAGLTDVNDRENLRIRLNRPTQRTLQAELCPVEVGHAPRVLSLSSVQCLDGLKCFDG